MTGMMSPTVVPIGKFTSTVLWSKDVQMVVEQYKNAAKPLITRSNNSTYQHFQKRYVTLF